MACCYVPSEEEEVMDLSGDSTVGYCGSSMEYESDVSSDPSSVTSESTGDSNDSYGSSVEVSDTEEEIESDGDDGNFSSDTWTFVDDDCAADELLNRYPFRPIVSLPNLNLRNMFTCSLVCFSRNLLMILTYMVGENLLLMLPVLTITTMHGLM